MSEISSSLFLNILIFLGVPFIFGYALKKINISPILGYLIAGIAMGTFVENLISKEIINNFAYFGILLLLFTIGLEVNFEKILNLRRFIVAGGILQILFSILVIGVLSILFHFTILQSLLIGIALSSSSTAIVAKLIQEKGEESSFIGELALGILMFQDLAFIPFIIIFTFFNSATASLGETIKNIVIGLIEAGVILSFIYYVGRKFVPLAFNRIVKVSRELLNLFVVLFIVFIAFLTSAFHVPIFVGMFVAGILVSQTLENYHVFSQVRPFRDILAIIFFIYIGTHVQLPAIVPMIPGILLFSLALVMLKAVVLLGIFLYFKFSSRIAFSLAVFLFQVSENAFILLSLAFANKIFTSDQYLFVISSVIISLILTPVMINNKDIIYFAIRTFLKKYIPSVETFISYTVDSDRFPLDELQMTNHVVVCGYGRIGSHIGRALLLANIPFIAIDYNFHAVTKGKREGIPILYGDPTHMDILSYAQIDNAAVIVIVIPDKYSQEAIILNAKKMNPKVVIISRVHKHEHQQRMRDLGAHIVVQPELEASLSIIKKLFFIKQMPKAEMIKKLHHFKVEQGITN